MTQTTHGYLAEKLLDCYSQLYEYSQEQQKTMAGQSNISLAELIEKRSQLFTVIEQYQNEFIRLEEQELSIGNESTKREIEHLRQRFVEAIDKIKRSDDYLNLLLQERRRQVVDKLKIIQTSQHAERQYRKMSENNLKGPLYPDHSRFYDQRK